jgi:hypothetical protein
MKTTTERRNEAAELLIAIEWLRGHVDCTGPLSHLPTSDPAVQVLCRAIKHLTRARKVVL